MVAEANREVIVKLRAVPDAQNEATFKKFLKGFNDTEKAKRVTVDQQQKAIQRAREKSVKAEEQQVNRIRKFVEQNAKARERAEIEAQKKIHQAQKAQAKRTISILKQQEKEAVAAEKAKQMALKQTEAAQRKQTSAQENAMQRYRDQQNKVKMGHAQIAERMNTALGDTMRFSRGLAMMGLAGEKNTQKLLKGLIQIQATVDVIGGGIGMFIRLTRVMRDYSEMTKAAAAAQTLLATAQGRTAATGAAAGAASAGGGVAAVGGAVSLISRIPGPAVAVAAATVAGFMAAFVLKTLSKAESEADRAIRARRSRVAGQKEGVIQTTRLGSIVQARWEEAQRATGRSTRGLEGTSRDLSINRQLLAAAKQELRQADLKRSRQAESMIVIREAERRLQYGFRGGTSSYLEATKGMDVGAIREKDKAAHEQQVRWAKEVHSLEESRYTLSERRQKEERQGAQKILDIMRQQLEITKREDQIARGRLESVEERIGHLTPLQRMRAGMALEKARKPGAVLHPREREALGLLPGEEARGLLGRQLRGAAQPSIQRFRFGRDERIGAEAARLDVASARDRKLDFAFTHRVELDLQASQSNLEAAFRPVLAQIGERVDTLVRSGVEAESHRMKTDLLFEQMAQERAAAGD